MAISEAVLNQWWQSICSALDVEYADSDPDGKWRLSFVDGVAVEAWRWQDEAALSGLIAPYQGGAFQVDAMASRFLALGLAKAAEWEECAYADASGFHLWRRYRDPGDPDFSIAGFEKFLNRLDFWRGQSAAVENQARRQSGGGGFIAFDQFG